MVWVWGGAPPLMLLSISLVFAYRCHLDSRQRIFSVIQRIAAEQVLSQCLQDEGMIAFIKGT